MKKILPNTASCFVAFATKISKTVASVFVLMLSAISLSAQTPINANLYSPVVYGGCIDTVFTLKYESDTTHILKIKSWLTNGDSSCTLSSTKRQVFISVDSSNSYVNASTIVLDTLNGFFSCHVSNSGSDSVYIRYKIFIDCSVLKDTSNQQSIILHQSFNDSLNNRAFNVNGLGNQISIPALKVPIIRNSFTFQQFGISYLDSSYFEFRYENKSDLPANISFHFVPGDTTVCSHATTLGYAFADSANNNFQSFNTANFTNAFIPPHTYLYVRHYATLTNCMDSICTDTAKLYWQCNYPANTSNIFCASCLNVTDAVYQVQNIENPILEIQSISPQNNYYNNFNCFNDTANMLQWDYRIVHAASSIGTADTFSVTLEPHIALSDNWLALIPESEIQVTVNCQQCTVETDSVISAVPLLCNNYINDAIARYTIHGLNFKHDDTIYFHVKVFRCAVENDAVLLNQGKYLNQYKLNTYAQGICPLKNNSTTAYLSKELEQYVGTPNINQNVVCFPATNNLNVPSQQTFGDTLRLALELNGLQAQNIPLEYQHLACGDTNPPYNCKPKGLIRIRVALETGLVIMNPASQVFISGIYNLLPVVLTPVSYHDSVPDSVCMAGNYYFYFNATDTLLYLLTYGKLFCTVRACCPAEVNDTHLQIAFHLLPNPDSCFTVTFNSNHITPPTISNSNAAFIPLSSFEFDFDIHCPGCLAPGLIVDRYRLKRTSFGLKDSDNDGIADSSLAQIANDTAYINTHDLKTFFSSYGDTLRDFLTSHFQDGSTQALYGAPGGYTYSMMKAKNAFVKYLQFKTHINLDSTNAALFPQQYVLYNDSADASSNHCMECKTFEVDTAYKTKLALSIPFASLNHYMTFDTLAGTYFFTFSTTDSLYSLFDSAYVIYRDTVNPFVSFEIGQRYRLAVRYNECFHFDAPPNPITLDDVERTVEIVNEAWLSGAWHSVGGPQMPNDTLALDIDNWTFNQLFHPNDSLINQQFADYYIFYCEWNGGVHYFFSQDVSASNFYYSDDSSCGIRFISAAYCRTAGSFYNPYPYEFRPHSLYPATYDFYLPLGYHATTGFVQHTLWGNFPNTNGFFYSPLLPVNVPAPDANRVIHIQLSDVPSTTCLQESSNFYDSVLYVSSHRLLKYLIINLQPDSCSISTLINSDTTVTCTIGAMNTPCWNLATCNDSIKIDGDNYELRHIAEANLQLNVIPDPTYAATNKLCWQVILNNPLAVIGVLSGSNVYSTAAPNVFLITPSVSYLNNWSYTPNGSSIPILPTGNIIEVDNNIIVNGSDTGMLCATYDSCITDKYFHLFAGYNCSAMPDTPFVAIEQCHLLNDSIHLLDEPASFTTNGKTSPVNYSICQPFSKTAEFYLTNNGSVYPDSVSLINLPVELNLLSVQAQGCDTTLAPVTLNALNANTWSITPLQMDTMGFTGQALTENECERIKIIINLETGCNGTDINSLHDLILYAHSYCNEPLSANTNNCVFNWDSTSNCTDCFSVTKTVDINPVNALDTVTYSIIVCANNGSSQTVYLEDILPQGFVPLVNLATNFPAIPAQSCDTFFITGYFLAPDDCPNTTDTARLITFAYSIDTLEATVCNTVNLACYTDGWFVPNTGDTTFTMAAGMPVSNATIYLPENFYFDASVTFTNCTIYVAMGKQVFIYQSYSLSLDSSIIEGCGFMWQGIVVDTTSYYEMKNGSYLRDANIGILPLEQSTVYISNSNITDCITGIYIDSTYDCSKHNIILKVFGTKFGLIRPALYQDYPTQPTHGSFPKAGIEMHDMPTQFIGDNAMARNYFNKLNTGLVAQRSTVRIYNSRFENIQIDTLYQEGYRGSAIVSKGRYADPCYANSDLTVHPNVHDTTVYNCYRGIYTSYSNLFVDSNRILQTYTGIFGTATTDYLHATISNCTITASFRGINWRENVGASKMWAVGNKIIMSNDTTSIAIRLNETTSGLPNYYIESNRITLNKGRNGIHASGVKRPSIVYNYISQLSSGTNFPTTNGIFVDACDSALVSCNVNYTNYPTSNVASTGIRNRLSPNGLIQCNTTTNHHRGFYFADACGATVLRSNAMDSNQVGLYLNNVAFIGLQNQHGNRWKNYSGTYGARNMNYGNEGFSQFNIHTNMTALYLGAEYYPNIDATNLANTWFFKDTTATPFSCDTNQICSPDSIPSNDDSELERSIASNNIETIIYSAETQNIAEQFLFDKHATDTVWINSDTLFTNFYNTKLNAAVGKLNTTKRTISALTDYDPALVYLLSVANSLLSVIQDSINLMDSLNAVGMVSNYDSIREHLINQVNLISLTKQNLLLQLRTVTDSLSEAATIINTSVVSSELPEANSKTINEIVLKYKSEGVQSIASRLTEILSIAQQCPSAGGVAVIIARNLVEQFNENVEYDDDAVCLSNGIYRVAEVGSQIATESQTLRLIPNPATTHINLKLINSSCTICKIEVLNVLNETIRQVDLKCKTDEQNLNVEFLPSGFYLIKVTTSDNFILSNKLIISR
jgi:hypothetical protein